MGRVIINNLLTDCLANAEKNRTSAVTYGPNEVRFVQKAKVRIYFNVDQIIGS